MGDISYLSWPGWLRRSGQAAGWSPGRIWWTLSSWPRIISFSFMWTFLSWYNFFHSKQNKYIYLDRSLIFPSINFWYRWCYIFLANWLPKCQYLPLIIGSIGWPRLLTGVGFHTIYRHWQYSSWKFWNHWKFWKLWWAHKFMGLVRPGFCV